MNALPRALGRRQGRPFAALRTLLHTLVCTVVVAGGLTLVAPTAASAAEGITVTKSAPSSILVGGNIGYGLAASNPSSPAVFEYNLTFRDVLPLGVKYVDGSTSPASFGDPTIITAPVTGQQTLIWSNVSDLAGGSKVSMSFSGKTDAVVLPVGATTNNTGDAYVNSNPRFVPRFNANGTPRDQSTANASGSASTTISAIEIHKSEPSPEHELLRGVHDHPTVYTLKVDNNGKNATNTVKVVDYLPAGLEFLGCGGVDNSTAREYPGAASLTATPAVGATCPTPNSVTTVSNPAGYPNGVYTRVEWNIGTLAGSQSKTIEYAAGVPMRENALSPVVTAATANLDNNQGPSTRETLTEKSLTNFAEASGSYSGVNNTGQSNTQVLATDKVVVTAEDLAVQKSVTPGTFSHGGIATYTLKLEGSEYVSSSNISLTDHLPNGLCPLDDLDNYEGTDPECNPGAGFAPTGATIVSSTQEAGGGFTTVFSDLALGVNGTRTVTYKARMRTHYASDAEPTSSGDNFTNTIGLDGKTDDVDGQNPPVPLGVLDVKDDSSASIASDGPQLDKTIKPNTPSVYNCSGNNYVNNVDGDQPQMTFTEGSRICFQVRIDFSAGNSTRDPIMTDFLPEGVAFEAGSIVNGPEHENAPYTADSTTDPGVIAFTIGSTQGGHRYVDPGSVFEVRFSGIVTAPAVTAVDVTGNLAKFRWTDRDGGVKQLRDRVNFSIPPAPPVGVDKRVALASSPASLVDDQAVSNGTKVRYQVDLKNNGSVASGNGIDIDSLDVWDVLPPGFRCADVDLPSISNGGVCTNPGDAAQPTFASRGTLSAIRWTLPATPVLAPGDTRSLSYEVTAPSTLSVDTSHLNTAFVRSYKTPTNLGTVSADHFPLSNIDTTVTLAQQDVPAAADVATIHYPKVTLSKTNLTTVNGSQNSDSQIVPGENVSYTIRARLPAHTTVFDAVLSDPMPANLDFQNASAAYSATNVLPAASALPSGVTLNATNGTLSFPATYQNTTASVQLFEVTITAKAQVGFTGIGTRTNTATFASRTAAGGLTAVPDVTAASDVAIIQPVPTFTKVPSTTTPTAGSSVTYTLTAADTAATPTLFDSVVVDCVPAGLTVTTLPAAASQTPGTGVGANGCALGDTKITWPSGDLVAGAAAKTLDYVVTVDVSASGSQAYVNTAILTGSTLGDGANNAANERVIALSKNSTITVPGASATKTIANNKLTVGELGTWTVKGTFPANINFYDAALTDILPAGIDPTTLTTTSVTCKYADTTTCTLPTPGNGSALTASGQQVGWFVGDLAADAKLRNVTVVFTAKVFDNCTVAGTPSCNTIGHTRSNTVQTRWDLTNKANPTAANAGFDKSANSGAVIATVQEPFMQIAKSVSKANPAPGETFTYTVKATDKSVADPGNTSPAYNVVITDAVPVGVVVNTASIVGGSYDPLGRIITWTIPGPFNTGDINAQSFTYTAQLAGSTTLGTGPLVNTARINSYDSLATGGRAYTGPSNTATVTPAFPHITVAKSIPGGAVAYVGESKAYKIVITSDGGSPAYNTDVTDVLPKNWAYDANSATVKVAGGSATPTPPGNDEPANPQTLTWNNLAPGGLAVGTTIEINYTAHPITAALTDPGNSAAILHTNTASAKTEDQNGADHNTGASFNGGPKTADAHIDRADLVLDKSHTGSPVAGKAFSWKVAVSNVGPDAATGPFTFVDTLPSQMTGFTASGTNWDCSTATTTVTCTHPGPVANNASLPDITVAGTVPSDLAAGTTLTNAATVSGHTYESATGNNGDSDAATVTTAADLEIDKNLPGPLVAGQNATYTIDVNNTIGPSTSRGPITITDDLPAGTTFVSASGGPSWSCSQSAGTVTCDRAADLLVGEPAPQITVVVAVPAGQSGNVVNKATITATTTANPGVGKDTETVSTPPTRNANLTVAKTSDAKFIAGEDGTYTITVGNTGPSTATNVKIIDHLPSYLTYVSSTSSDGWTCTASGQDVSCNLTGSLAVGTGQAASLSLKVAVDPTYILNDIVNVATASANEDPDGASDDDHNEPGRKSDLQLSKTHAGDPVAGEQVSYALKVTNAGPSASDGPITITDSIPAGSGLTYKSASGSGWLCDVNTGGDTVTCGHLAGLGQSATSTVNLTFDIAADAGPETIVNQASVTGPQEDPTPANNNDDDETKIVDKANVTVTKTAADDTVHAGDPETWTIVAHNDGPSDADAVVVGDALPDGLTVVSAAGTGWTCDIVGAPVTCSRDTLAAGTDAPTITLKTKVGEAVPDGSSIKNIAHVSTSTTETNATDNDGSDTIGTTTSADLSLVKSSSGTPVAGENFPFRITVHNAGPSDAHGPVVVKDTLPVGLTFVSSNTADWDCAAASPTGDGQVVSCTLVYAGDLLSGEDAHDLVLTTGVAANTAGDELTNTATVSSATNDPIESDNTDDDSVTPSGSSDLAITKTHVGDATAGTDIDYTITVVNKGNSDSDGTITVQDTVPDHMSYVPTTTADWTCELADGTVTCDHAGGLDVGDNHALELVLRFHVDADAPLTTPLINKAEVDGPFIDPVLTNDKASDDTTILGAAEVSIKKTVDEPVVLAGTKATWTIVAHNDGPSDASNVTVEDTIPAGLDFVSVNGDGWTCTPAEAAFSCERGTLANDADAPDLTVVTTVGASVAKDDVITNTATVTTTTEGDDPAGNSSDAEITVDTEADLSIAKTHDEAAHPVAGSKFDFDLLVHNAGPSDAQGPITVTDHLPSGMTFVGNAEPWSCEPSGQDVTCTLPTGSVVEADTDAALLTVTVKIGKNQNGNALTNTADVTSSTFDPNEHDADPNNIDSDTVTPGATSDLAVVKSHPAGTKAVAGEDFTYTIAATNNGPSDTVGQITVTDEVPEHMTYESFYGVGWDCDPSAGTVTCTYEDGLDADDPALKVDLTFHVASDAGETNIVNTAVVDGPNPDDVTDNDSSDDPTDVIEKSNVSVTKRVDGAIVVDRSPNNTADDARVGNPRVVAGKNATWTLTAHNDGPSDASDVTVTDTVPAGLTLVSAAGDGWKTCTVVEETFTCILDGTLGHDSDANDIVVVTTVKSDVEDGTTIENTAEISTTTAGDDDADNTSSASIDIDAEADLRITKTHDENALPVAGKDFTFALDVKNLGYSDAQGPITITDTLPKGMSYVPAEPADAAWTCEPSEPDEQGEQVVTCSSEAGIAAEDDAPQLLLTVHLGSTTQGTELTNSAAVSSTTTDPHTDNNTGTDSITPDGKADLSITKTHTGTATIGGEVEFTLTAHNDGPSEARGVKITDDLPDGLTFVSVAGAGWTCTGPSVDCTLVDELANGVDSAPLKVTVTVGSSAYRTVTNTATVDASTDDPNNENNTADDTVTVNPAVDLSIDKLLDGALKIGENATYVLTVHNDGPTEDPATVTVTDQLPAGLEYVSAEGDGWSCDSALNLVSCDRAGGLASDETAEIVLTVLVGPDGYPDVTNEARVTSPTADSNPDNNVSSVTDPVKAAPFLTIKKTLAEHSGTSAVWTLTVTNTGLTPTGEPIIVLDDLPNGLRYTSEKGADWTCDNTGHQVTCENPEPLAIGDTTSFDLTTKVTAGRGKTLRNVASVMSTGVDGEFTSTDDATMDTPRKNPLLGALPYTGGTPIWMLGVGLVALLGGVFMIRRRPNGKQAD